MVNLFVVELMRRLSVKKSALLIALMAQFLAGCALTAPDFSNNVLYPIYLATNASQEKLEEKVKAGDYMAMYAYGVALNEGLNGIEIDEERAQLLKLQATEEIGTVKFQLNGSMMTAPKFALSPNQAPHLEQCINELRTRELNEKLPPFLCVSTNGFFKPLKEKWDIAIAVEPKIVEPIAIVETKIEKAENIEKPEVSQSDINSKDKTPSIWDHREPPDSIFETKLDDFLDFMFTAPSSEELIAYIKKTGEFESKPLTKERLPSPPFDKGAITHYASDYFCLGTSIEISFKKNGGKNGDDVFKTSISSPNVHNPPCERTSRSFISVTTLAQLKKKMFEQNWEIDTKLGAIPIGWGDAAIKARKNGIVLSAASQTFYPTPNSLVKPSTLEDFWNPNKFYLFRLYFSNYENDH